MRKIVAPVLCAALLVGTAAVVSGCTVQTSTETAKSPPPPPPPPPAPEPAPPPTPADGSR